MKQVLLNFIKIYQKTFSPDHGVIFAGSMRCRFYPSCSQYTYETIEKFGIGRGIVMGFWRIFKCNPLSKGGVDLVQRDTNTRISHEFRE